jgi:hypothetical protein
MQSAVTNRLDTMIGQMLNIQTGMIRRSEPDTIPLAAASRNPSSPTGAPCSQTLQPPPGTRWKWWEDDLTISRLDTIYAEWSRSRQ